MSGIQHQALATFPNLAAPIWDRVRIPARRPVHRIAEEICAELGLDPELVRTKRAFGRAVPPGLTAARERIMRAIFDAGMGTAEARDWFIGFSEQTLRLIGETPRYGADDE